MWQKYIFMCMHKYLGTKCNRLFFSIRTPTWAMYVGVSRWRYKSLTSFTSCLRVTGIHRVMSLTRQLQAMLPPPPLMGLPCPNSQFKRNSYMNFSYIWLWHTHIDKITYGRAELRPAVQYIDFLGLIHIYILKARQHETFGQLLYFYRGGNRKR